ISQAKETKPFSCTLILSFLGGDANILSEFLALPQRKKERKKNNDKKNTQKKDGTTAYKLSAYLGVDPMTGKQVRTTRQGFK
ncbi:hypothetical protein MXZ83_10420, partial [Streptococcus uberis]|nr:hypothetical protein [Streptococcus uberis]